MYFDLPLDQLKSYLPARQEPSDFDAFWQETLAHARQSPLEAHFEPVDFGLQTVETFDVTFNGYAGQPVKGWLLLPRHRSGRLAWPASSKPSAMAADAAFPWTGCCGAAPVMPTW